MTTGNDRTEYIRKNLAALLLRDYAVAVVTPGREAWRSHGVTGFYQFGWTPPMMVDGSDVLLVVSFCPEVIAETTAHLDEENLDVYLSTIEWFLSAFIDAPGADVVKVRQEVESQLYEKYPDALALMSDIEAKALD